MPSLRLYTPINQGRIFAEDLSGIQKGYTHTLRKNGGYWLASMTIFLEDSDKATLTRIFDTYIGYDFAEIAGGKTTFEGIIYELDLVIGNVARRRSLDEMANYLFSTFVDENNISQVSAVSEHAQSQSRYGRKEDMLMLDGFASTAVINKLDTALLSSAWPWARPSGVNLEAGTKDRLDITIAGHVFTANWRHLTASGSTANLSTFMDSIVTTDCEFLTVAKIETNTVQVEQDTNIKQLAWDKLKELIEVGSATQKPARGYVYNDRKFIYETIPTDPDYYLHGDGLITTGVGRDSAVDPWSVKPGVVRDLTSPLSKGEFTPWLTDIRDFYASEVSVSEETGLSMMTDDYQIDDILTTQSRIKKMLEKRNAGVGGGGSRNRPWHSAGVTAKEWSKMSPAERRKARRDYANRNK